MKILNYQNKHSSTCLKDGGGLVPHQPIVAGCTMAEARWAKS